MIAKRETRVDFANNGNAAVRTWVRGARAGDRLTYHVGDLAEDRQFAERLDEAAMRLLWESKRGNVHLVQRRIAVGQFEYIAERSRR